MCQAQIRGPGDPNVTTGGHRLRSPRCMLPQTLTAPMSASSPQEDGTYVEYKKDEVEGEKC